MSTCSGLLSRRNISRARQITPIPEEPWRKSGDHRRQQTADRIRGLHGDNGSSLFDVEKVRADFPILRRSIHGKPLVYLDNAATSQKPAGGDRLVSETYYEQENANIHRGVHFLSELATKDHSTRRAKDDPIFPERRQIGRNYFRARSHRSDQSRRSNVRTSSMSAKAMKCSSQAWSITRTSCRGRFCARRRAQSFASHPINDRGELLLDEFEKLLVREPNSSRSTHVSETRFGSVTPSRK